MSGGKKKSGNKKSGFTKAGTNSNNININNGNGNESNNESNNLIRPTTNHTINPRGILTGFYQKNGKRVLHTVHDGALQMPKHAVRVIEIATAKLTAGMVQSIPKYDLPGLDSVVRPCLDPMLETIFVTELVMEKVQIPQEQPVASVATISDITTGAAVVQPVGPTAVKMIKTSRPTAKNRRISRIPSSSLKRQSGTAAERIRGGGDVPMTEGQQPHQKVLETVVNMDIDRAGIAAVELSATVQTAQIFEGETPPASHNDATKATNNVTMAPEPPQDHHEATFQSIHQEKMTASNTKVATDVHTMRTIVNSNIDNSKDFPNTIGGVNEIDKNSGAVSTTIPPAADVKSAEFFFASPKNVLNDINPQSDGLTDTDKASGASISDTPASGLSTPPSATISKALVGLVSKESDGEIKITPIEDNEETPQKQFSSVEMSIIATSAAASTNALSSNKAITGTESLTRIEGNRVATENSAPHNSSLIKPVSAAKAQISIQSSDTVNKPSEADTKPTKSVASMAIISTYPADPIIVGTEGVGTEVVGTTNSTAESGIASSVVKIISSAESHGVSGTRTSVPPTTLAIPEVTPSTPVAGVKAVPTQVKEEQKKPVEEAPETKYLPLKPAPQWEQHKPGSNDETITPENQLPPKPEWYKKNGINEIERTMLPEWFDSSSSHRTPEAYIKAREKVIEICEALSNRNITNAMIRRSILGDAGSLQRLRNFLVNWGIINRDGINDSAPTTASLRPDLKRSENFNDRMRDNLILAVTEQATKKRKLAMSSPSMTSLSLDWQQIACQVGYGVSAESCRDTFMSAPLKEAPSDAMDCTDRAIARSDMVTLEGANSNQSHGKSEGTFIQKLVGNSDPKVLKKVFDAAIEATSFNSVEAQAASLLGIHASQAVENARGHEIDLALRLSKLLDARMQKLENRMAMLDDVEGILEAEKVALEMERRDLYTARCRHWFGGV